MRIPPSFLKAGVATAGVINIIRVNLFWASRAVCGTVVICRPSGDVPSSSTGVQLIGNWALFPLLGYMQMVGLIHSAAGPTKGTQEKDEDRDMFHGISDKDISQFSGISKSESTPTEFGQSADNQVGNTSRQRPRPLRTPSFQVRIAGSMYVCNISTFLGKGVRGRTKICLYVTLMGRKTVESEVRF